MTASYLPIDAPADHYLRRRMNHHDDVVSALKTCIAKSAADVVLLSSEHLSSRFRAPQIAALARNLDGYDCKIIVTFRDHLVRFFSSYAMHVMSGSEQTLDDYAEMILRPDMIYMRFAEMVRDWEVFFGRNNIEIVEYFENRNIVDLLLERLGLARLDEAGEKVYRNSSLDPISTEAVRLINVALREEQQLGAKSGYLEHRRREYIRAHLANRMRQTGCSGSWALGNDVRARLADIARADRQFLAEAYGLDLRPSGPSACSGADVLEATSDLLARMLTKLIVDRPMQRAVMASRSLAFSWRESTRWMKAR